MTEPNPVELVAQNAAQIGKVLRFMYGIIVAFVVSAFSAGMYWFQWNDVVQNGTPGMRKITALQQKQIDLMENRLEVERQTRDLLQMETDRRLSNVEKK